MMETKISQKQLTTIEEVKKDSIYNKEAIKEILKISSPSIGEQHIDYFVNYCKAMGLNPIEKEIHGYTNGKGQFVMVVSYTTYLKRVMEHFERKGIEFWYETNLFKDVDAGSQLCCEVILHEQGKPDKKVKSWIMENDKGTANWKSSPRDMLEKCAITKALRRHYPTLIGNLPYAEDEVEGVKTYESLETKPETKTLPKMTNTKIDNVDLEKTLKELNINVI